jgi:hypothetical protein
MTGKKLPVSKIFLLSRTKIGRIFIRALSGRWSSKKTGSFLYE